MKGIGTPNNGVLTFLGSLQCWSDIYFGYWTIRIEYVYSIYPRCQCTFTFRLDAGAKVQLIFWIIARPYEKIAEIADFRSFFFRKAQNSLYQLSFEAAFFMKNTFHFVWFSRFFLYLCNVLNDLIIYHLKTLKLWTSFCWQAPSSVSTSTSESSRRTTMKNELTLVRLSAHFGLNEFLNISKYPENIPTMHVVVNQTYGCHQLLEPARPVKAWCPYRLLSKINSHADCLFINKV